ncbi:hypothetical protein L210DRAFT_2856842 [Boletus edulis BED1]|uniref:Uncharacterized protein n=1 Tax=Boletus edulis BED1 TaxID=1328754 RepID=A0AAD4BJE0_BOLED|nr:hypothetical protein L210DRAFT_2856842 [Boletus edulis BED1]
MPIVHHARSSVTAHALAHTDPPRVGRTLPALRHPRPHHLALTTSPSHPHHPCQGTSGSRHVRRARASCAHSLAHSPSSEGARPQPLAYKHERKRIISVRVRVCRRTVQGRRRREGEGDGASSLWVRKRERGRGDGAHCIVVVVVER